MPQVLEALAIRESGSGSDRVLQVLTEFGLRLPDGAQLAARLQMDEAELHDELQGLCNQGRAVEPLPGRFVAAGRLDGVWSDCREILTLYHKQNPLHAGMKVAELRQKLFQSMELPLADALLGTLAREGKIRRVAERYALWDFEVRFTKRQGAIREKILQTYRKAGLESPATDEVVAAFPQNERQDAKQVLESSVTAGELVMLTPQICWCREAYETARNTAAVHFQTQDTLTLAELRDLLHTSRKYALALLEYLDKNRVTKKEGDYRRLLQGF